MLNVLELALSMRYETALANGCEVKLDYEEVAPINKKHCPYFYGSKEYGNNLSFQLTNNGWKELAQKFQKNWFKDHRLNLFENGLITISELWYNGRKEEWEEEEVYKFEGKEKELMISYIDYMLAISPIRKRNDNNFVIGNYQEALKQIKKF